MGSPRGPTGAGYDCNGNLAFDGTRTFAYDTENRLIADRQICFYYRKERG